MLLRPQPTSNDERKSDAPDPRASRRRSPAVHARRITKKRGWHLTRFEVGAVVGMVGRSLKMLRRRPRARRVAPRGQQRSGVFAIAKARAARLTLSPPSRPWGEVGAERSGAAPLAHHCAGPAVVICHCSFVVRWKVRTVLAVRLHRFDVSHTARATCETSPIDERRPEQE